MEPVTAGRLMTSQCVGASRTNGHSIVTFLSGRWKVLSISLNLRKGGFQMFVHIVIAILILLLLAGIILVAAAMLLALSDHLLELGFSEKELMEFDEK